MVAHFYDSCFTGDEKSDGLIKEIINKTTILVPEILDSIENNNEEEIINLLNSLSHYRMCIMKQSGLLNEFWTTNYDTDTTKRISVEKQLKNESIILIDKVFNKRDKLKSWEIDRNIVKAYKSVYRKYYESHLKKDVFDENENNGVIYLNKSVVVLSQAESVQGKLEFSELLMVIPIIRDSERCKSVLDELIDKGEDLGSYDEYLLRANRLLGILEKQFDPNSVIKLSYGGFIEERKRYRELIRKYKKLDDTEKLKNILNEFYIVGVLAEVAKIHEGGEVWQNKKIQFVLREIINKLNCTYSMNGRIVGKYEYISNNDWKTFEKIFGKTKVKLNPVSVYWKPTKDEFIEKLKQLDEPIPRENLQLLGDFKFVFSEDDAMTKVYAPKIFDEPWRFRVVGNTVIIYFSQLNGKPEEVSIDKDDILDEWPDLKKPSSYPVLEFVYELATDCSH